MSDTDRVKRRGEPVCCVFCGQALPRPVPLAEALLVAGERSGGRCPCGALFLLDATGREGGQVLLDGLTLLCEGDMDRAMRLQVDVDYQVQSRIYNPRGHCFEAAPTRRSAFGLAKLWLLRSAAART